MELNAQSASSGDGRSLRLHRDAEGTEGISLNESLQRQVLDTTNPFVGIRRFGDKFEVDYTLTNRNIEFVGIDDASETFSALLTECAFSKQVIIPSKEYPAERLRGPVKKRLPVPANCLPAP